METFLKLSISSYFYLDRGGLKGTFFKDFYLALPTIMAFNVKKPMCNFFYLLIDL